MGNKEQLQELQDSQAWHQVVSRLEQEINRQQSAVMEFLRKGDYKESHQALGLVLGYKICLNLPHQMVREMEGDDNGTTSE